MKSRMNRNNLTIHSGEIRVTVNQDPEREIAFHPSDLHFAEGFYDLLTGFETKRRAFVEEEEKMRSQMEAHGGASSEYMKKMLSRNREMLQYLHEQVDVLFGEGAGDKICGGVNSLEMYEQFFNGIAPYIQQQRSEKMRKYQEADDGVMQA